MEVERLGRHGASARCLCRVGDFHPCTRLPAVGLGLPTGAVDAAEGVLSVIAIPVVLSQNSQRLWHDIRSAVTTS
jgi:hypothetical protein